MADRRYPAQWRRVYSAVIALTLTLIIAPPGTVFGWFADWRLTQDPAGSFTSPNNARVMACDAQGTIHVVWYDGRDRNYEIYHATLDSLGWRDQKRLTNDPAFSGDPAIAADPVAGVHVVWRDDRDGNFEIYYKRFDGESWGVSTRITSCNDLSWGPSVACDGDGTVHVVWHDNRDGDFEIYHKSFDGLVWSLDTRLTDEWGKSQYPSIAADDSGRIHVVWQDYRDYRWDIYYKRYDGTWSADEPITHEGTALYPCIAAGRDGRLHVVWEDHRNEVYDVYYRCFDTAWGPEERLTDVAASCRNPSVAVDDSGGIHVVWQDYRHAECEIYYKVFDGSWVPDERLTDASGISAEPSVAVDRAGEAHVVWHDYRDGNAEVYWNRSTDGIVPRPVVTSIEPDSGGTGFTIEVTDLAGEGFVAPARARLQRAGHLDITASRVQVVSETRIACNIDLIDAEMGIWDVVVQNPNGLIDTLPESFKVVRGAPPRIDSIAPSMWRADETLCGASLWGDDFNDSVSVWLQMAGEADILAVIEGQATSEQVTFSLGLGGAASGGWDVVVENPDGQRDTLEGGFEVARSLWEEETRLTTADKASLLSKPNARCMAVDASGNLHLVWYDLRGGWDSELYYRMFDGTSWGSEVVLAVGSGDIECPAIASDGNNQLHVVWVHEDINAAAIYYRRYEGTWTDAEQLTPIRVGVGFPSIATDSLNTAHVVWQDTRTGNGDIYYKSYNGASWSPDERLSISNSVSLLTAIEADKENHLHVVWLERYNTGWDSLFYTEFDGAVWSSPQSLAGGQLMGPPSIAVDPSDDIYVAWHMIHSAVKNIYCRKCTDGTWQPIEQVTFGSAGSRSSSIAIDDSGTVFVVWVDDRHGDGEIYSKCLADTSCEPNIRLTYSSGSPEGPATVVDRDGRLHVAWEDDRDGNYEIYYTSRSAGQDISAVEEGWISSAGLRRITVSPTPTSGSARMRFSLDATARPTISVYDVMGRSVWHRKTQMLSPGTHQIVWHGRDLSGELVTSGIYFVVVETHGQRSAAKIVIIR